MLLLEHSDIWNFRGFAREFASYRGLTESEIAAMTTGRVPL